MKFLILSLLFLTGTQGRYLWQGDEPQAPDGSELLEKFVDHIFDLAGDVVDYMRSSSAAKEEKIMEKYEAVKADGEEIKKVIDKYAADYWEEVDKELNKKYPVFMKKGLPLLEDFAKRSTHHLMKMKRDIASFTDNLFAGFKKQVQDYLESVRPVAEKGRDKIRKEVEALRAKFDTIREELREELERNRKIAHAEFVKLYNEFKEEADKEIEDIKASFKPYLDKMKDGTGAEDLRSFLHKLLEEIKDAVHSGEI
uniref:Uncharacterized protein n=1 Tax=Leptobrachium leishanense TaxID=445787 RepID=A0A8C5WMI2_9ANUR